MDPHYHEWLNLLVRWIHLTVGIAWIGASFYFNWLENNLNRSIGLREGLAGNLWAIHGGGFYYLEKYKVAPEKIPETLHWFKWEAYFTWISGFLLLVIVYYMQPSAYLLDSSVSSIGAAEAISLCIGSLAVGWLVYDLLCRSPLGGTGLPFAIVCLALVSLAAYGLYQVISPRAAYLHVGAIIGTIMAGNVFRVIIPSQKALVRAAIDGSPLDASLGLNALRRSRHNNYLTLPVLFVMLSNHFPSTYGHEHGWLVLVAIVVVSVGVRHYFNIRKDRPGSIAIVPAAVAAMVVLAVITKPRSPEMLSAVDASFTKVRAVLDQRCVQCHSATPRDNLFTTAPNGVMFDTADQVKSMAERIKVRAVDQKTMPLANLTHMTDEERAVLASWYAAGAPLN